MAMRPKRRDRFTTMRFVLWALSRPKVPSAADIASEFGICDQSARAWRKDWLDARAPAIGTVLIGAPQSEQSA